MTEFGLLQRKDFENHFKTDFEISRNAFQFKFSLLKTKLKIFAESSCLQISNVPDGTLKHFAFNLRKHVQPF